jgi:hypothetical protein
VLHESNIPNLDAERARLFEFAVEAARLFKPMSGTDGLPRFAAETVARVLWRELRLWGVRVEWPADMIHGRDA